MSPNRAVASSILALCAASCSSCSCSCSFCAFSAAACFSNSALCCAVSWRCWRLAASASCAFSRSSPLNFTDVATSFRFSLYVPSTLTFRPGISAAIDLSVRCALNNPPVCDTFVLSSSRNASSAPCRYSTIISLPLLPTMTPSTFVVSASVIVRNTTTNPNTATREATFFEIGEIISCLPSDKLDPILHQLDNRSFRPILQELPVLEAANGSHPINGGQMPVAFRFTFG